MSFLDSAGETLTWTRDAVKPTLKSANKTYAPGVKRLWASDEDKAQWDRRNANQVKAGETLDAVRARMKGLTMLRAGQSLYDSASKDASTFCGNCGEQSCIALYIANRYLRLSTDYLWMVHWKHGKFGHNAALLGERHEGAFVGEPAAVCDPWMNIACELGDYPAAAAAQLREWTGKGKRVSLGSVGVGIFKHTNWVEPSNADIVGFWLSPTCTVTSCMTKL